MTIPSAETEEPVEVDQRGLIDKILARYSSKYAVFRELLQNADDATASKTMIRFETATYDPTASRDSRPNIDDEVIRWVIKNNGTPLSDEDWDRLKVIANGNPNALKIGTFGVGFYSVFAVTEEPCVRSGNDCGRFKWKQKTTAKGRMKQELSVFRSRTAPDSKPWTTSFELPVGPNDLISQRLELGRFLVAALPFMSTIESISLYFDSTLLLHLSRVKTETAFGPSDSILWSRETPVSKNATSKTPAFKTIIDGIKITNVRIEAEVSPWLDSPNQGVSQMVREFKNLQLWSASAKIQPNDDSRKELEKATKKRSIPKKSEVQITFEDFYTLRAEKQDVIPKLTTASKGYVYIGHATTQTTGFLGHLAGHFIPTVERELLDLENKHVKGWNEELLYISGCLARKIYDHKMESIKSSRDSERFYHLLGYFTFDESNPHPRVSTLVREAFFTCTSTDLVLLTPDGDFPANKVRDYNEACTSLIKHLPMVDKKASMLARKMMGDRASILLKPVTFDDLVKELEMRPLSDEEMISCLNWVTADDDIFKQSLLVQNRTKFLSTARLSNSAGSLLEFSTILSSPPSPVMTSKFPLPRTTVPRHIVDGVGIPNYVKLKELFQAKPLLVDDWLTHVCEVATETSMFVDVCKTLSDHWSEFSDDDHNSIKDILCKCSCIFTRQGLQAPKNAYLSDSIASTFPTLPIIDLDHWAVANKEQIGTFLSFIGVQSRIELTILKTHIVEWDNQTLLQYFLGHEPSGAEIDSLKPMPLFAARGNSNERFKAADLYAPNRDVEGLGLTVLSWRNEEWSNESKEAKLLFKIGLRKYPDLLDLLKMASGTRAEQRENALNFLLKHFEDEYKASYLENHTTPSYAEIPFIPVEGESELSTVSKVYINHRCVTVGFRHVRKDFRIHAERFKVQDQPSPSDILDCLRKSPPTSDVAQKCFEYLFDRVQELKEADILTKLRDIRFIPLVSTGKHCHVTECYLVGNTTPPHYQELFTYVNFTTGAAAFLKECGSQEIPSASEIANLLFTNPSAFYRELNYNQLRYMWELRGIAQKLESDDQEGQLRETLESFKGGNISPSLLGCDYLSYHCMADKQNEEDSFHAQFLRPEEVVIMNDELNSAAFQHVPDLYYAPKVLEELYKALGCKNLSQCVFEEYRGTIGSPEERRDHPICHRIRAKILGRLSMFLARYKDSGRQMIYQRMNDQLVITVYDHIEAIKVLESPRTESRVSVKAGRLITEGDAEKYELWISETEEEKLDYFQLAYCVLGYLYETPTSNICCLFMTLLISTDEQLKQRGYRVPSSPVAEQRLMQDREHPRPDFSFGRPSLLERFSFEFGRENQSFGIDPDVASDFETPIPNNKKTIYKKRDPSLNWFRRNKQPQSELDDESLQKMLQHAVSGYDYNESSNNAVSFQREKQDSSCGGRLYGRETHCIQEMNKGLPYAVWGGKDADARVLDTGKKMRKDFVRLFKKFIEDILDPLVELYDVKKQRIRLLWDDSCHDLAAFTLNTCIYLNVGYFALTHHDKIAHHEQIIVWYHLLSHEMAHRFYADHCADFELFCSRIREKYMVKLFTLPPLKRAVEALEMYGIGRDLGTHVPPHVGISSSRELENSYSFIPH